MDRLKITTVDNNLQQQAPATGKSARRQEIQATMERLWLNDPEQFNPERDAVQRKRTANTIEAITKHVALTGKRCADLGCGSGKISGLLRDGGAQVDAVDIASQALNILKTKSMHNITAIQDCLPMTRLEDGAYDLVVCTETIGYLNPKEYRLLFAELSRLMHKESHAVCSTSLDLNSDNALERFAALAETEFEIDQWVLRYDLLWTKCCRFLEMPSRFIKASQDMFERNRELEKRKSLGKVLFRLNSSLSAVLFWKVINLAFKPLATRLRESSFFTDLLEKTTKFLFDESGISHALFIGKRRPMVFPLPQNEIPIEMKHKKQVWE